MKTKKRNATSVSLNEQEKQKFILLRYNIQHMGHLNFGDWLLDAIKEKPVINEKREYCSPVFLELTLNQKKELKKLCSKHKKTLSALIKEILKEV